MFVYMCKVSLYRCKSVKLFTLVHVSVMLYLTVHCVLHVGVCTWVCMYACAYMVLSNLHVYALPDECFTEVLYEKKQTIMTYENETAKLQAQVDDLKATSADKDTLIAKYEAIFKESDGKNVGQYEIHLRRKLSQALVCYKK